MSLLDTFGRAATRVREAAHRRHAHHDLRRMDAYLLRDIGIYPCAVPYLAATLGLMPGNRVPHDCKA